MLKKAGKALTCSFFLALAASIFAVLPTAALAADDDVPFFVGIQGLPNVMFIFDNSDSMQDVPYPAQDESGNPVPVRPDWPWRQGVKIDGSGFVVLDENGDVDLDDTKNLNLEEVLSIPGRNPPDIPGRGSLTGEVTSVRDKTADDRIYDDRVDWDDPVFSSDGFKATYGYYRVMVEDENGAGQYTNLISYNDDQKCWIVSPEIEYQASLSYSYTILAGVPEAVTYESEDTGKLFDCHVDWETAHANWTLYRNKVLEIVNGTGSLKDFSCKIDAPNKNGYWVLGRDLPQAPPVGTRYRIVGSADDDRYAKGGNHPESKMYQAKKALKTFLESDKIKVCEKRDDQGGCIEERYLVNFGFGAYMSARVPGVKAKYYRRTEGTSGTVSGNDQYSGLYETRANAEYSFYDLHSSTQFTTVDWKTRKQGASSWTQDQVHRNLYTGYKLERLLETGPCGDRIATYVVYQIVSAPTDSSAERHLFKLRTRVGVEGGEPEYARKKYSVASCEGLPETDGDWTLIDPEGDCSAEAACEFHEAESGSSGSVSYYETKYVTTWGDYTVTDPQRAGYVDVDGQNASLPSVAVTPCPGFFRTNTGKCISYPNPENGDFTLVTETVEDVPLDAAGTDGDIEPNSFDVSFFRYPADGTSERPHGWSYQKTEDDYLYKLYKNYPTSWPEDGQPEPYFPSDSGEEQANHKGDDQVVFIDLPEYKSGNQDSSYGDDVAGQNVSMLLNYISLARAKSPDESSDYEARYDYTMMPYTGSLAVNSEEEVDGSGTPLAASLRNVRKYYESYIDQDELSQGGCRDHYVILLTDGLETCDGNPVKEAAELYGMSIDGLSPKIKTYVIGFGMDEESRDDLDAIAKAGGTEQAYFASNVEELVEVLADDIVKDIFDDSYSRASPVLSKKILDEDQLKIFTSYFDYPIWRGHLEGRYLLNSGDYGEPLEGWGGDCSDESGADGDAGCEMARHGRGRVLTNVDGSLIDFRTGNVSRLADLVNPEGLDIDGDGEPGTVGDALVVIGYTLDSGFEDGKYKATRDEDWPLGDIYNSSPVWVCPPGASATYRKKYEEFAEKYADRPTMLYVGANDGMVHAFFEENGRESWAFIPASVLCILNEFREGHRFTVDLKIKAADVLTEKGWKTILASGLREGGRYYYALDVTNPDEPEFLWEITDGNLGKTYSIPSFGQIAIEGINTGVLFFGGGYSTGADMGNRVYIVRADNGEILSELTVGASLNNVPSELLTVRFPDNDENVPYRFHTGEAVSSGWRGNTEFCYFGDMAGTLWRLGNLNSEYGKPWEPTLEPLFVPEHPRPVTHKPAVWDETDNCQRRFIEFGTGDELNPASLTQNHFYEIEDISAEDYQAEHPAQELTAAQIAEGRFRLKWQYDFSFGEQLLTDPTTYYGLVYFITYKPSGGCAAGMSYAYSFTTSQCLATSGGSDDEDGTGEGTAGTGSEPEGSGGGEWFGFPDLEAYDTDTTDTGDDSDDTQTVRPLKIPGITSSLIIAPPMAYISQGDPIPVPADPATLLYWRESQ